MLEPTHGLQANCRDMAAAMTPESFTSLRPAGPLSIPPLFQGRAENPPSCGWGQGGWGPLGQKPRKMQSSPPRHRGQREGELINPAMTMACGWMWFVLCGLCDSAVAFSTASNARGSVIGVSAGGRGKGCCSRPSRDPGTRSRPATPGRPAEPRGSSGNPDSGSAAPSESSRSPGRRWPRC